MFDYNFVGQVQLTGPVGLSRIRQTIERELNGINVQIGTRSLAALDARLKTIGQNFRSMASVMQQASSIGFQSTATELTAASRAADRAAVSFRRMQQVAATIPAPNPHTAAFQTLTTNINMAVRAYRRLGVAAAASAVGPSAAGVASINALTTASNAATAAANAAAAAYRSMGRAANRVRPPRVPGGTGGGSAGPGSGWAGSVVRGFAVGGASLAIRGSIDEAIRWQHQMTRFSQLASEGQSAVHGLGGEIKQLSASLGVSGRELGNVAETLVQAGIGLDQTKTIMASIARSSLSPTFKNMNETVEGVIAAMGNFNTRADDVERVLGGLSAVSGRYAVESTDLVTALRKTGAVASQTGGSIGELAGIMTAVRSTTRLSADAIATSLNTAFARMERPETVKTLKGIGVELRYSVAEAKALGNVDLAGRFVGPLEAIRRTHAALEKTSPLSQTYASAVEQIGGLRNLSRVVPAIQHVGLADEARRVFESGGSSLVRDAETAQNSLLVRLTATHQELLNLLRDIGDDRGFQGFVRGTLDMASGLIGVTNALKPLLPLLATLGAVSLGRYGVNRLGGLPTVAGLTAFGRRAVRNPQVIGFGASLAGSVASAGIDVYVGEATPHSGSSFVGVKGLSGALGGAAIGAQAGLVAGPWGAAVGATIGSLAGLKNAIQQAADDISNAKIGKATTALGERLARLANGTGGASDAADVRSQIGLITAESNARDIRASTSWFSGYSAQTFAEKQGQSERQNFGKLGPAIDEVLSKEAERLAKSSPNGVPIDLAKNLYALNHDLLDVSVKVRNTTLPVVLQEYAKTILGIQRDVANAKLDHKANLADVRSDIHLGTIATAFEQAADQANASHRVSLHGAFGSRYDTLSPSAHLERLSQTDRFDQASLKPVNMVASLLGRHDGPSLLKSQGQALADVGRVLPVALSHAIGQGGDRPEDIASSLRESITDSLKKDGKAVTAEIEDVLASIEKGIRAFKDVGDLAEKVESDASGLASELLSRRTTPFRRQVGLAASAYEKQAGLYTAGLGESAHQRDIIGESSDVAARLKLSAEIQRVTFAARRDFREDIALRGVPLGQLNAPINEREQRLLGGAGLVGNPEGIGRELEGLRERIQKAATTQQERFAAGDTKGFLGAANELSRLSSTSSNYRKALEDMTKSTERNAAAQSRLAQLEADRQGRFSLAERFATADPEERMRLHRATSLAVAASRDPRVFDRLRPRDRADLLSLASSAGASTQGFFGGRSGHGYREYLLSHFAGGAFRQPAALSDQRREAEKQITENDSIAARAAQEIARVEQAANAAFLVGLKTRFDSFLSGLGKALNAGKVIETENELGNVARQQQRLVTLDKHRGVLSGVGVRDDAALTRLRSAIPDVEDLVTQRQALTAIHVSRRVASGQSVASIYDKSIAQSIRADAASGSIVHGTLDDPGALNAIQLQLESRLGNRGIAADATQKFARNISGKFDSNRYGELFLSDASAHRPQIEKILQTSIQQALNESTRKIEQGPLLDAETRVRRQGFNPRSLETASPEKLKEAVKQFGESGTSLRDLDHQINATNKRFQDLNKQLDKLKSASKVQPPKDLMAAMGLDHMASGGIARGTDVVPSVLTPGEFVVSRQSAQANLGLLHRINAAKGPLYLADGGLVDRHREEREGARLVASLMHPPKPVHSPGLRSRYDEGERARLVAVSKQRGIDREFGRGGFHATFDEMNREARDVVLRQGVKDRVAEIRVRAFADYEATHARPNRGVGESPARTGAPVNFRDWQERFGTEKHRSLTSPTDGILAEAARTIDRRRRRGMGLAARPVAKPPVAHSPVDVLDHFGLDHQLAEKPGAVRGLNVPSPVILAEAQRTLETRRRRRFGNRGGAALAAVPPQPDDFFARQGLDHQEHVSRGVGPSPTQTARQNAMRAYLQYHQRQAAMFRHATVAANHVDPGAAFGAGQASAHSAAHAALQSHSRGLQEHARFGGLDVAVSQGRAHFVRPQTLQVPGYASGGAVKDTVHAMLAEGEWVLRPDQVQRIGADKLRHFANGGPVGNVTGPSSGGQGGASPHTPGGLDPSVTQAISKLNSTVGQFTGSFSHAITSFNGTANNLARAMSEFPKAISLNASHRMDVNVGGLEILAKLKGEVIEPIALKVAEQAVNDAFKKWLPRVNRH